MSVLSDLINNENGFLVKLRCESKMLVALSSLILLDPMDSSPPGSFVHGI